MIHAENICVSFENKNVFKHFSFSVKKGEKICLWGSSGSGKTTLLNCLLGFVIPFEGSIKCFDLNLNEANIDNIRKNISWLPQNINLPIESAKELFDMLFPKSDISGAAYPPF